MLLVALAASACESGWDVAGHITTDAVPDKSGTLHVYLVDEESIDPTALRTASTSILFLPYAATEPVPADGYDYSISHFGCHHGAVAIAAWAPAPPLPAGANLLTLAFAPQSGDYVAISDVRDPYCGTSVHTERIDLTLALWP
jgi:hypothetical protein